MEPVQAIAQLRAMRDAKQGELDAINTALDLVTSGYKSDEVRIAAEVQDRIDVLTSPDAETPM